MRAFNHGVFDSGGVPTVPLAIVVPLDFTTSNTITGTGADFTVDWGDGNLIPYADGEAATALASGTIRVVGPLTHIRFDTDTFTDIDITDGTTLTSLNTMCQSNTNLVTFNAINTQNITDFTRIVNVCTSLTSFPLIDTSGVLTFNNAFRWCSSLTSFPLIDTSSATDFQSTWENCTSLQSMPLIDTSAGTNFLRTFNNCTNLVCLSSINTLLQVSTVDLFTATPSLVSPNATERTALLSGSNYVNANPCP